MPPITPLMAPLERRGEFAGDTRSLLALQTRAAADPKAAARDAARQFESLFMGELLKSMRGATESAGLLENAGTKLGTEMLDQQLAGQVSGRKGGLSEAILRQLERQLGGTADGASAAAAMPSTAPSPGAAGVVRAAGVASLASIASIAGRAGAGVAGSLGAADAAGEADVDEATPLPAARGAWASATGPAFPMPAARSTQPGAAGFVQRHGEAARRAEADTGIPASFLLSQAALETGWGRKEIRHPDGSTSHNLFGIKAGANWKGPVAEVATTEYVGGRALRTTAKFRAYASYAESFADYGRLMQDSPRYQGVLGSVARNREPVAAAADRGAAFAHNLQRAGYATDPAYASKLTRVINTTLRLQRSLA